MSFNPNYLDYTIVDMYKQGYSVNKIVDKVFRYSNKNKPQNQSYGVYAINVDKPYTRLDCVMYVGRVILNHQRSREL